MSQSARTCPAWLVAPVVVVVVLASAVDVVVIVGVTALRFHLEAGKFYPNPVQCNKSLTKLS